MADIPGNTSTTARLPIDRQRDGDFESNGDADWYRVSLEGGRNYVFRGGISADPDAGGYDYAFGNVSLRDGRGRVLESSIADDYDGYVGGFDYRPDSGGNFFLAVESSSAGDYEVAYELDTPAEPPTGATIRPGQTREGEFFSLGDQDAYGIRLEAGEVYDFAVLGSSGLGLAVLDSRGLVLASTADGFREDGPSSSFERFGALVEDFRVREDGTYYLRAESDSTYTGPYTLAAERDPDAAPFDPDAPPSAADDLLLGGAGADLIDARAGDDLVFGLGGDDTLRGGVEEDDTFGGVDSIFGGDGNDALDGGSGRDFLYGEAGDDTLRGGEGQNSVTGGSGNDTFLFPALSRNPSNDGFGLEQIEDFGRGRDEIDLSAVDANADRAGNQAFRFVGTGEPTAAGQLAYGYDEDRNRTEVAGYVEDPDAANATFTIRLPGRVVLDAGDFVL